MYNDDDAAAGILDGLISYCLFVVVSWPVRHTAAKAIYHLSSSEVLEDFLRRIFPFIFLLSSLGNNLWTPLVSSWDSLDRMTASIIAICRAG